MALTGTPDPIQSQLIIDKPGSRHRHLAIRIRQRVFDCKYLSCKICFNVLNYVFILFTFNLYRLVNFNSLATILAVVNEFNSDHTDP